MIESSPVFTVNNEFFLDSVGSSKSFVVGEAFWNSEKQSNENLYQQISHKVSKNPKQLLHHLQRIYFTYFKSSQNMNDQLYAALVDLLWVLDGRGEDLSKRMVFSTRSKLTEDQLGQLVHCIKQKDISLLTGNKFSLLTTGLIGTSLILTGQKKVSAEHDPLLIAHDYIEFSQLDQAREVLETAVFEQPERQDLQDELLELYKVTKDKQAFTKMYDLLIQQNINLPSSWQELSDYNSRQIDDE
jgi:hypothetical protein